MQISGLFLELSVIGYFGWHALIVFGLDLKLPWFVPVLCSLAASTLFFLALGQRLWMRQLNKAKKAVAD